MARFARRGSASEPTSAQLRAQHLLVLPDDVDVVRVEALLRCRVPDARLVEQGRVPLGRRSAISGPHRIEPDQVDDVRLPPGTRSVLLVQTEPERDPGALDHLPDDTQRQWWTTAFPDGKPFREEGDAIALALHLARRFGGVLRVGGGSAVLRPDPLRLVDLTVWSGLWIDPEHLLAALEPLWAGAGVDLGGQQWNGPATQAQVAAARGWTGGRHALAAPDPLEVLQLLGSDDHAVIEAVASQVDAHALQGPDTVDGYALTAHGDLVVEVTQQDAVPDWVRARVGHQLLVAGDPVVTYAVRWHPDDPALLESESPPHAFRLERQRSRPRVHAAALAVVEMTAGVLSDSAGFEVDRYSLQGSGLRSGAGPAG
jgi:hypothetical protein